jgi:uncharacterized protein
MLMTNKYSKLNGKVGIGLRSLHHIEILNSRPDIDWLEVHTENFFANGGSSIEYLEKISQLYPISFHGVNLSLGSSDGLNIQYLQKLKTMIEKFNPALVSEHLSWTAHNGIYTHDLLPIPYTKENLAIFAQNIDFAQNFIGREILIENPSSYLLFANSTIPEDEFMNKLAYKTKCGILLDVNNIYVSSTNNKLNPNSYKIEKNYIKEIHLAGHTNIKLKSGLEVLIDTHSTFICTEVWQLYKNIIAYAGAIPTLIEWDQDLPELQILIKEAAKSQKILDQYKNGLLIEKHPEVIC